MAAYSAALSRHLLVYGANRSTHEYVRPSLEPDFTSDFVNNAADAKRQLDSPDVHYDGFCMGGAVRGRDRAYLTQYAREKRRGIVVVNTLPGIARAQIDHAFAAQQQQQLQQQPLYYSN